MIRGLALLTIFVGSPAIAQIEAIRLDPWTGEVAGRTVTLPLAATMSEAAPDKVALTFEVELAPLVDAMPGLLSQVYSEGCDHRFAIDVGEARPVGGPGRNARLRLDGRVRYDAYDCSSGTRGRRTFEQTGDLTVELGLVLQGSCPRFEVSRLDLTPDGLGGFLLDASGATEQIERDTRRGLSEAMNAETCFDLPTEMRLLNARATGATFVAPNERLGAHLSYELTATAETLIDLAAHLARN